MICCLTQFFANLCFVLDNEPCTGDQFRCVAQDKCIPVQWYCNGIHDCVDNSDEPDNCE